MKENSFIKRYLKSPLLKNSNFLKELASTAISRFGDGIDTIAFSWLSYKITGSTLLVATLFALNGLPNIIFGALSGGLSKYYSKKSIITFCDIGRGICVMIVAILSLTKNLEIWHLYVVTFLNSTFEAFRSPAATAMVPEIIPVEDLEEGIAISSSSSKVAELIGLAMAPVIIALSSIEVVIIVDALTFFICGILISSLKLKGNLNDEQLTIRGYLKDLKEGFLYIIKDKLILNICIFGAVVNALVVPLNAFQAPFVEEVLNRGPDAMAFMNIPLILAMTIGVVFAPKVKSKIGGRNMFIWGGVLFGINYCLLILNKFDNINLNNLLLIIESFLMGIGIIFINFPVQIAMFKKVDKEYLSRVAAICNALMLSAIPITSCIIGVISKYIGIREIFILFGALTIFIFIMQYLNKEIKKFETV
jgi:MFS transporter, DHA3 family, macrolide efflux protein